MHATFIFMILSLKLVAEEEGIKYTTLPSNLFPPYLVK